jgi:hypothetical protein
VEGSLVYAASAALRERIARDGQAGFELDLLPARDADWVRRELAHPRGHALLSTHLKTRLKLDGVKAALLWEGRPQGRVSDDPAGWRRASRRLPVTVQRARPIDEAISSAGGVRRDALDDGLMLKALPGVFCAGEMLDWEAPTGGYLLTACLATGRRRAGRAARWLREVTRPPRAAWHTPPLRFPGPGPRDPVPLDPIATQIAAELKVRPAQVQAAVDLLDGGATVPFIARYRKEATDGLDDIQLRELEARLSYLRELEDRRAAVLKSIAEQGKLTPELQAAIEAAPTKQELEDLYLPFKPRRRTKGMIAREAGLEPLADRLLPTPRWTRPPRPWPSSTPAGGFADVPAVLDGVRDLLSERWAEDPCWWARCANGCGPRACCRASWSTARTAPPRCRQVPRLLRLRRADPQGAVAPRAGGVPRPHAGSGWTPSWCWTRRWCRAGPRHCPGRRPHRAPPGLVATSSARATS